MILCFFVTLLAAAAVTPGQRTSPNQPQTGPTPGGMAYYVVRGNQIISPPYADPASCAKALAKFKSTMQPGVNLAACAHRLP